MKTVYLCENAENVKRVFGVDTVYRKQDVMASPALFADTEYIFSTWEMPVFTEQEIEACLPSLKAVFYGAGTVQAFARPFLNRGVKVFSAWAANAVPVAEYTVAQILLANKSFFRTMRYQNWDAARATLTRYKGNWGSKVGIIGAGMIGKQVIRKLLHHAVHVLVYDPFLSEEDAIAMGAVKCSLETLFAECDVVSNHVADNEQTKGMLTKALFELMPENATFINTGRGAQVVEADLIAALKARPDLTAVLDVVDPEPPLESSELLTLTNCILTPHIAGSIGNEVQRMGEFMNAEYDAFTHDGPCRFEVTLAMLETMA